MQVDVMPTLFGLMNLTYEYEGFGVDLLKQQRPMVFYSADNQIVARDHQRCFVYNTSMNRSFFYDVLPNGNLKETKQESDNQIVARDHQRCFVYNPSMNRSFCYDVLPNGNLKETKQESKFRDLKTYVFSNIQAAEYIERHQQ